MAQQGRMEKIALKQKRNATEKKIRAMPFFLTQKRVPLNRICLLRKVKITLKILKNKRVQTKKCRGQKKNGLTETILQFLLPRKMK